MSTYINVPIAKGAVLRLTVEEYRRALQRGKAWKRAEQRRVRNVAHLSHGREQADTGA